MFRPRGEIYIELSVFGMIIGEKEIKTIFQIRLFIITKKSLSNQYLDVWDITEELLQCLFGKCFVLLHTK